MKAFGLHFEPVIADDRCKTIQQCRWIAFPFAPGGIPARSSSNTFRVHCSHIRWLALEWLRKYLTNWHQFVFMNDISSSFKEISCGVSQGSILGPLFFSVYINDFDTSSHNFLIYSLRWLHTPWQRCTPQNCYFRPKRKSMNGLRLIRCPSILWKPTLRSSAERKMSIYKICLMMITPMKTRNVFLKKLGLCIDQFLSWEK